MKQNLKLITLILAACFAAVIAPRAVLASADTYEESNSRIDEAVKNAPIFSDTKEISILSKSALLMDFNSGTVLYAQNENDKLPIASMTKIMTLLITFENLEKGVIKLSDVVTVSSAAAGMGGSQAFLDANAEYKISDLVKSAIIASANDSCVALAETIAGSESAFVDLMNDRAGQLGLLNTHFVNCTGLPAPSHFSSALDVASMTRRLIGHKDYFMFSTIWMDDLVHPGGRVTGLTNTNKLTRFYNGCDGGKTGFTAEAKHCISATAVRGDMRLISVIIAAEDGKTRFAECSSLLNYGFNTYENKLIFSKNKNLAQTVAVKGGKTDAMPISVKNDFYILSKKGGLKDAAYEYTLPPQIKAPITRGEVIGSVKVIKNGECIGECEIVADLDILKLGLGDILKRFIAA
jgi:D-alanyl-D-alanine carboxypeptidase (penicillin-binding protein 5/6)